jgi:hypothetical protein
MKIVFKMAEKSGHLPDELVQPQKMSEFRTAEGTDPNIPWGLINSVCDLYLGWHVQSLDEDLSTPSPLTGFTTMTHHLTQIHRR